MIVILKTTKDSALVKKGETPLIVEFYYAGVTYTYKVEIVSDGKTVEKIYDKLDNPVFVAGQNRTHEGQIIYNYLMEHFKYKGHP